MERITVTLQKKTLRAIKQFVGPRGVSRFLNEAAEEKLGYTALGEWLREQDRIYGPVPAHVKRRVDRQVKRHLGITDASPRRR